MTELFFYLVQKLDIKRQLPLKIENKGIANMELLHVPTLVFTPSVVGELHT